MHSAGLERATAACEATTLPMRPLRVWMMVCQWCLDGPDSPDKQNAINKKKDGKSEC